MKLTVVKTKAMAKRINYNKKDMLCRRIAHCRLEDSVAVEPVETVEQGASMRLMDGTQHTGTRQGRHRLFEHMRSQGEQVETLWESGKTIRHLTQEEGKNRK